MSGAYVIEHRYQRDAHAKIASASNKKARRVSATGSSGLALSQA
jgi:hypothetical protein